MTEDPSRVFTMMLSPIGRLRLSFAQELERDPQGLVLGEAARQATLSMHAEAVHRRNKMFRSMIVADGAILLLLYGKEVRVPGFSMNLFDLPAALEMASIFASLAFLFGCMAFFNEQAYLGMLDQWRNRKAIPAGIDPDFVAATEVFHEFALKAYRERLSIWRQDFFIPQNGYKRTFSAILLALKITLLAPAVAHLVIVGAAVSVMWGASPRPILSALLGVIVILIHLCAVAIAVTMVGFKFKFTINPKVQHKLRPLGPYSWNENITPPDHAAPSPPGPSPTS